MVSYLFSDSFFQKILCMSCTLCAMLRSYFWCIFLPAAKRLVLFTLVITPTGNDKRADVRNSAKARALWNGSKFDVIEMLSRRDLYKEMAGTRLYKLRCRSLYNIELMPRNPSLKDLKKS